MAILLKKITLILFPVAVLMIMLELLARTIPSAYRIKHDNLMGKKDRIEILVLGSSHAGYDINPRYFGREAFNLSNASQGLYQDYKVLMRYLPECKNVKMVIVPISYFSFRYDMASSPASGRCAYYPLYMGVQGDESSLFDLRKYSALALWGGPIEVVKNALNPKKADINEYGCESPEKTGIRGEINDNTGKTRVDTHEKIMNADFLNANVAILSKMAADLGKRNIRVVFVVTPVYKTYYKFISKTTYEEMTGIIASLSLKYSAASFNYFYDNRFELSDFWDNDHLNETGTKKFSIILNNDIVRKLTPD